MMYIVFTAKMLLCIYEVLRRFFALIDAFFAN